ncbi:hypothetical protein EJ076_29555 [Mesorhizobium sp. M7D.F.Ca.US.005.01.1.1]|uniref:hypothetical protein n=1 Tax=Mesorhizobium sp. M7D.F.Ca.US.005.01.1.1 TaxID=2493678 RepID=UPI000F76554E|nr:hypothetical protein [Mesorhizobium sp. M7D.F.Ca.US.005.01.1.1]AZO44954.1 hypothetical protein EJ076_29555 [Mesorhizobium sp. M7D.F.Ca.US.005.01.1.1]
MLLIRPKFVALDSSHLGAIADDKASKDGARLQRAAAFEKSFEESGGVLLLCWHHFEELLSHGNDDVVARRVTYLQSLPLVAAIASFRKEDIIGSVIDQQAFEVATAFEKPLADAAMVRDEAAKSMFRLTNGADLVRPFLESWSAIRAHFINDEERPSEIMAISKSDFAGNDDTKIADLLKGKRRSPEDIQRQLDLLQSRLAAEIRERGDERITDPELSSQEFMQEVRRHVGVIGTDNPGQQILELFGIDVSEIYPDTTVADVGNMSNFRKRMATVNQKLRFSLPEVIARVHDDRLPSGVIANAIAQFHPDTRRWDGSELADRYLACLSAYADVTYVDKRTYEAFRIARQKSKTFASLARDIEKAGSYSDIAEQLSSHVRKPPMGAVLP